MINVGIVGLGRIADLHFPGYEKNKDARIYAVCDIDEATALSRQQELGAEKHYTNYHDLLNDKNVDAVEILLPHKFHEEAVIAAAKAGKHIAIQKPMSISLESAQRMINAAKEHNVILKVTDNYCFYPPFLFAKKLIEEGEIGEPINIRISFVSGTGGWKIPANSWEWRVKENAEGRGFQTFDHGHHLWATAWFFFGEVERVLSWIDNTDGFLDCPSVMMWKYKNSSKYGTCEFVHASELIIPSKYYANDEWLQITGSKGVIFINRCTGLIHQGPAVSMFNNNGWHYYDDIKSDWGEGFIGAAHNFIAAIKGEEKPMLSAEQGMEILKFNLALSKSSRERREVYLDEMTKSNPETFTKKTIRKELKEKYPSKSIFSSLFGDNTSKYAPQAKDLTYKMVEGFNADAVKDWKSIIGLHLTGDGNTKEIKMGFFIENGNIRIEEGSIPKEAVMTIKASCGIWAAILLKKKKLEMAFIQGKIKIEGKAEEGLKLRSAFGI